jgi:hypothetical protein
MEGEIEVVLVLIEAFEYSRGLAVDKFRLFATNLMRIDLPIVIFLLLDVHKE